MARRTPAACAPVQVAYVPVLVPMRYSGTPYVPSAVNIPARPSWRPRKRRTPDQLQPHERWVCPRGCGKIYKKTSCSSIVAHRSTCEYEATQNPGADIVVEEKAFPRRRRKNKPRRSSSELQERERWYCPFGCGKFYKRTSTKSVSSHRALCAAQFTAAAAALAASTASEGNRAPSVPGPMTEPLSDRSPPQSLPPPEPIKPSRKRARTKENYANLMSRLPLSPLSPLGRLEPRTDQSAQARYKSLDLFSIRAYNAGDSNSVLPHESLNRNKSATMATSPTALAAGALEAALEASRLRPKREHLSERFGESVKGDLEGFDGDEWFASIFP